MKGFEKFILIVFSVIMIVLSIFAILSSAEMIESASVFTNLNLWLVTNKIQVILIGIVVIMLGLVGIFSNSDNEESIKSGLAIKNDSGTVYITKDTFESIILNVAKDFASLRNVKVAVNIDELGISANIYVYILPDTVVPTLTQKLQDSIKEAIKSQTTVDIREANIKVKGVYCPSDKRS